MKIEFPASEQEKLSAQLVGKFASIRNGVQLKMAERMKKITQDNLGIFGVDRPIEWAELSPSYARKVGRTYATLLVTGKLRDAIKVDTANGAEGVKVAASNDDVPYARAHQLGYPPNNLPARPYFPMDRSGTVIESARLEIEQVAREALAEALL